jgi:hypothetical protein
MNCGARFDMMPEQKRKWWQRLAFWRNPFAFVAPDICVIASFSPVFLRIYRVGN